MYEEEKRLLRAGFKTKRYERYGLLMSLVRAKGLILGATYATREVYQEWVSFGKA